MDFTQKLAQTRTYTQTNQNGVDSQEVYNEAILNAITAISPVGTNTNTANAFIVTTNGVTAAGFVAVSFSTSSDFAGTIAGPAISASTIININAEPGATLTPINYTISAGSITIVTLVRP